MIIMVVILKKAGGRNIVRYGFGNYRCCFLPREIKSGETGGVDFAISLFISLL